MESLRIDKVLLLGGLIPLFGKVNKTYRLAAERVGCVRGAPPCQNCRMASEAIRSPDWRNARTLNRRGPVFAKSAVRLPTGSLEMIVSRTVNNVHSTTTDRRRSFCLPSFQHDTHEQVWFTCGSLTFKRFIHIVVLTITSKYRSQSSAGWAQYALEAEFRDQSFSSILTWVKCM